MPQEKQSLLAAKPNLPTRDFTETRESVTTPPMRPETRPVELSGRGPPPLSKEFAKNIFQIVYSFA
jgi:hypothetical protein